MSIQKNILGGGALTLLAAIAAQPASAQVGYDRDHNTSVNQRAAETHRADGVRAGAFLLFPEITFGIEQNDNIFAEPSNETEDTIFGVRPAFSLQSQWSVHELQIFGDLTSATYQDNDDDNTIQWRLGANGELELNRDMSFTGGVVGGQGTEDRYAAQGPAGLREPIEYNYFTVRGAFARSVNQFRASIGAEHTTYDFDDGAFLNGTPFDQDFRDHDALDITGRLDFAVSPDTALFTSVTHRTRDYDQDAGLDRDSEGWRGLVGANFDLSSALRGEIGVGYTSTSFDSPALEDVDGFAANARLEWFPTEITTINLGAVRDTYDSGLGATSSLERTSWSFGVDHELRRSIVLHGGVDFDQDEYQGIDRSDDRTTYNAGVDWYLNRSVITGFNYQRYDQDSSGTAADRDFEVNRFMLSVTLRR